MKILVAALAVFFMMMAAPATALNPRAERPMWSAGDEWTYAYAIQWPAATNRKDEAGERTSTVVKIESFRGARAYFVSFSGVRELSVFDEDINVIAFVDAASGAVVGERAGMHYWSWPLEVGKSWTFTGTQTVAGRTTSVQGAVVIEGYEDITVPAGTFGAFKSVVRTRITAPDGRVFEQAEIYWWTPAVGNSIKYSRVTSTGLREQRELIRYTLKNAK